MSLQSFKLQRWDFSELAGSRVLRVGLKVHSAVSPPTGLVLISVRMMGWWEGPSWVWAAPPKLLAACWNKMGKEAGHHSWPFCCLLPALHGLLLLCDASCHTTLPRRQPAMAWCFYKLGSKMKFSSFFLFNLSALCIISE